VGEIGYLFNLIITFPIFNGLVILYHLFGDFGLAIVVLTLVIKLILFPLTLQQLKSMKANQVLQPQLTAIRKKYADDQQAMMRQIQALYKEYGVNPMAGCLPLVIQMPVLYGLYFALSEGIRTNSLSALNQNIYPFVQHFTTFPDVSFRWFSWLSFLNPIFHLDPHVWTWTFPLNAPDPSHILPIIAGLATFISLRMSQPKTAPATNNNGKPAAPDPTQQSMKMMQYIMPFFIVFIGWNYAAGLALYWTVSSIFQAVQQFFVTGWGSLLPASGSKAVTATASTSPSRERKAGNTKVVEGTVEAGSVVAEEGGSGAIASKLNTTPKPSNGNGSSYSRNRQRGGSASARRRSSNNAQRARR
jgi:YidC/Oxa1 family membrane protein insertase